MFRDYKKNLFESYKNIAGKVMPTLKESNFSETGMLTPDEFIKAGDYLVKNYSNWSWYKLRGNSKKNVNYLPEGKQMLVNNNIICNKNKNIVIEEDEFGLNNITKDYEEELNDKEEDESDDDCGEYDLSEFELTDNVIEDVAAVNVKPKKEKRENKYNISITYDNYFRTPRLWLMGFNSYNMPLSHEKMLKDISIEHSKITVTVEEHPYYSDMYYISVHPCKHGHVMKRLIEEEKKNKKDIQVFEYFIYFLKFVSTIIPNLDFDRTFIKH